MNHIGHNREKEIFRNALENDRLVHAYIFSGTEGSGKKHFALSLAKSLLCRDGRFFEDCECPSCTQADTKSHPDIALIEKDDLNIENIRSLAERAYMSPLSGSHKVFIIDDAHLMRNEAANAFLKTLEEPGENTLIILLTSIYDKILPTIRSRCINIEFSMLSTDDVNTVLKSISDEENTGDAAELASGSVGYGLYLLENTGSADALKKFPDSAEELFIKIRDLADKDEVRIFCSMLYAMLLEKYKTRADNRLIAFSNYLLDILKRLDYNVSLKIVKLDLYSKTSEVFL